MDLKAYLGDFLLFIIGLKTFHFPLKKSATFHQLIETLFETVPNYFV